MQKLSILQATPTILTALILLILIIAFYLLGYRLRRKALLKHPETKTQDLGTLNGTLLGLLGLLLAFTFGMSNSRFDTRRKVVIEEVNSIGTAVLRTDIYPDSIRRLLRANFKAYVEARIAHYQAGMDMEKTMENYQKADSIGKEIWAIMAAYAKVDNITTRTSELVPALNEMIDITTTRRAAGEGTIPDSIMYFLFILCFCSAFLLGYDNKNKIDWIGVMGLAIMLSSTVFTIIDLDRPRSGLINMDRANQKMVELLDLFEE
ncbi:hypothetical protein GZH53_14665 [Flavihumibacter sp. R14]|nr:hypothetical protein [Flavihumibacter soli]